MRQDNHKTNLRALGRFCQRPNCFTGFGPDHFAGRCRAEARTLQKSAPQRLKSVCEDRKRNYASTVQPLRPMAKSILLRQVSTIFTAG